MLQRQTSFLESARGGIYVGNSVIDDRGGMIEFCFFGAGHQQSNSAAIEERQTGEFVEQFQPELVAIESNRALKILNVDCNLSDAGDDGSCRGSGHWSSSSRCRSSMWRKRHFRPALEI